MSRSAHAAVNARSRLNRVESLLDEALQDLTGFSREAPGSRCAAALAEAAAELSAFGQAQQETGSQYARSQHAALRKQLSALPSRLGNLERLLAASAEFYRGWCAAVPSHSEQGYQAAGWSNDPGPALLAFRG